MSLGCWVMAHRPTPNLRPSRAMLSKREVLLPAPKTLCASSMVMRQFLRLSCLVILLVLIQDIARDDGEQEELGSVAHPGYIHQDDLSLLQIGQDIGQAGPLLDVLISLQLVLDPSNQNHDRAVLEAFLDHAGHALWALDLLQPACRVEDPGDGVQGIPLRRRPLIEQGNVLRTRSRSPIWPAPPRPDRRRSSCLWSSRRGPPGIS